MNICIILLASFVIFALVQAQASQAQPSQDSSQAQVGFELEADSEDQGAVETPKQTIKYLDFGEILDPIPTRNATRNVTIGPTRPDPRQTEPPMPMPTYLPTPAPTPVPTPDPGPWVTKTIGHDQVKPFAQPEPVTIFEKADVKFKPQIQIRTGCEPYPAVNDIGETSGGLKTSGKSRGRCGGSGHGSQVCGGSGHGSQVYGRSTWINGVWSIMYSWYFPKDSPSPGFGHRHDWEHAVVFIDNPDVLEPKILACSVSSHGGYAKYNPCPWYVVDGTSLKVRYRHGWPKNHDLDVTGDAGTFQDLIMWDQMTEDARRALNSVSFSSANTPMNDLNFLSKLEKAWPF